MSCAHYICVYIRLIHTFMYVVCHVCSTVHVPVLYYGTRMYVCIMSYSCTGMYECMCAWFYVIHVYSYDITRYTRTRYCTCMSCAHTHSHTIHVRYPGTWHMKSYTTRTRILRIVTMIHTGIYQVLYMNLHVHTGTGIGNQNSILFLDRKNIIVQLYNNNNGYPTRLPVARTSRLRPRSFINK